MGKDQDLLEAARNGNIAYVGKILHSLGKRSGPLSSFRRSPSINIQDINGYTPLHHACLNGHTEIVRLLLAHDALLDVPDIRGSTPLYLASWAGHNDIVKILLMQSSVNPNSQTSDNETALHCAAQHGHNTVLATLLAYGADPTIRNNSFQTPLDLAAQFGRLQVVNILLRTHPELIEQFKQINGTLTRRSSDSNSTTPKKEIFTHSCLHLASRNGHKKVVEALLAAGIDVNILTHSGTALHEAALCGKKSVVSILLKAGVDPYAVDGNGRTVLDILKDYPPHVTYEITSIIKDFCNLSQSDSHFRPIVAEKSINYKTKNSEKFHSLPRSKFETKLKTLDKMKKSTDDSSSDNSKTSPLSNSFTSLRTADTKKTPVVRASYVPMKPILKENSSVASSSDSLNDKLFVYKPVYTKPYSAMTTSNNTLPRNGKTGCNGQAKSSCSPYELMCLASTAESSSTSSNQNTPEPRRFRIVDVQTSFEYVDMTGPHTTPTPTPNSNKFDFNNYENVNLSDDMKSQSKELETPALKRVISIDANNNKAHSPTPDVPPPSVTTAEKTIFDFMRPQNDKEKRRSLRINDDDLLELETYFLQKADVTDTEETLSEHVQEYVSDTPFAGLFKGSTLNLANDEDLLYERDALRSPSLVKSVIPVPPKRTSSSQRRSLKEMKEFSASTVWKEIDEIFERIGKDVEIKDEEEEIESKPEPLNGFLFEEPEPESLSSSKSSTLSIRKPKELLFRKSDDVTTSWCHSPDTLLYEQVEFEVFYLGSTVIRNLQGTVSTRLSIQKLKIDETEMEEDADADLLKDCTKSTKYLKANNLQTRLGVGIAISYLGVKFIDLENKSMICIHSIENINCVCQDTEDLRYFAYITRENDVHYCHVFMVDNLDLAKQIILTLGQAFEVAYQLAMTNNGANSDLSLNSEENLLPVNFY